MLRLYILLSVLLTLAGCDALNIKRSVAEDDVRLTKHIGVVSMLGDTFYGVSIGMTAFNNEYFSAPVPDWKINEYATIKALEALKLNNKFQADALDISGLDSNQINLKNDSLLWDRAKLQGFEKLVVIHAGVSDNMRFFKPGYGFYQRSLLFRNPSRCVYAGYAITVFDVSTRRSVGWEWGGGQMPCQFNSSNDIVFKNEFSEYSEDEKLIFRKRLEARISESIPATLEELSLIPAGTSSK